MRESQPTKSGWRSGCWRGLPPCRPCLREAACCRRLPRHRVVTRAWKHEDAWKESVDSVDARSVVGGLLRQNGMSCAAQRSFDVAPVNGSFVGLTQELL